MSPAVTGKRSAFNSKIKAKSYANIQLASRSDSESSDEEGTGSAFISLRQSMSSDIGIKTTDDLEESKGDSALDMKMSYKELFVSTPQFMEPYGESFESAMDSMTKAVKANKGLPEDDSDPNQFLPADSGKKTIVLNLDLLAKTSFQEESSHFSNKVSIQPSTGKSFELFVAL